MSHALEVRIPEHTLHVAECCRACPVQLGSWVLPADLLVLRQLQDFDVVLGMDWMSRFCATIDCRERTVTFREPGQEEFVYRGCQSTLFAATISSARARQLMSRGCIASLAVTPPECVLVLYINDIIGLNLLTRL